MVAKRLFKAVRARGGATRSTRGTLVLSASVVLASLVGCGAAAGVGAAPGTANVFFVKGERFAPQTRPVPPGEAPAHAAMKALLAGPTSSERAAGIETRLPRGIELVSIDVSGGTATVELRATPGPATAADVSLRPARAAQIVYTLTAVPGITRVQIAGKGVDRVTLGGRKLTVSGPRDKYSLSKPITLAKKAVLVPRGPASADARGVQRRLVSLRFLPSGSVSGTWNERTRHAVTAFQAWHRLDRDGIVGPRTLAALENASRPRPARATPGRHVEVHRDRGVTLLVENGKLVRAIHSSSGARGHETPSGTYTIFRKERNSWSIPYKVWLPYASYFNGGIAFHAHAQVPARPASHGCVRLPVAEAPFAYTFMAIGTSVSVY